MRFCTDCGTRRNGEEPFCTSCGRRFPEGQFPSDELSGRATSGRRPPHLVAAWAAVALVVGSATAGIVLVAHDGRPSSGHGQIVLAPPRDTVGSDPAVESQPETTEPETTEPETTQPETPQPSTPDESVGDVAEPGGILTLTPRSATYPAAPQIRTVLTAYFQAINTHDFQLYYDIHSPDTQASLSPAEFERGFRSSNDSDAVVTAIETGVDGYPIADVSFTSRQAPEDGPQGQSCTLWQVRFFFARAGDSYTIGAAPPDYHAAYQPC